MLTFEPTSWHLDVWQLTEHDNGTYIEATVGDAIVIYLLEHSGGGFMWDVDGIAQSDLTLIDDCRERIAADDAIGGHVTRKLTVQAGSIGFGSVQFIESRPWEHGTAPLTAYQFTYDISEIPQPGLLPAQRDRLLKEAE
jgi:predicted secreted protein